LRAKTQAAEDRHRRAPSLNGVLKQKTGDDSGKRKPLSAHRRAEREADQRHCRGIGLKGSLNVPLPVKFA
jgi:hypothetical protein